MTKGACSGLRLAGRIPAGGDAGRYEDETGSRNLKVVNSMEANCVRRT